LAVSSKFFLSSPRSFKQKQIPNRATQKWVAFLIGGNMHKRDEIIAAIKKCAERLGRAPSQAEFRRASKISWYQVYKHFRGMRQAVRAAGLEPGPRGSALDINALTLDWAGVVRKLGRLPSRAEYSEHGIHHAGTLHARIVWSQMSHKFVLLVREFHLEREWEDVVKIVVGKFPLLEDLPQRTQRTTEESTVAADWRRETQIGAVGRELTRMDTNENREPQSAQTGRAEFLPLITTDNTDRQRGGMRLGKIVAAALAIEILMAAQRTQIDAKQDLEPQRAPVRLPPDDVRVAQDRLQNTEEMNEPVDTDGEYGGQVACARPVVYGEPLGLAAMAHAPTNELGVLFLFGIMAAELGFRVERLQAAFPDCEAKREVAPGKWELVFIELEIYSRNFKLHRHNPRGCHAIVCWKHNWPDCPEWLEVIELSKVVKGLVDRHR
jgi:Homing endonuclease associated repeat